MATPPTDPARSAQMALVRGKNTKPEIVVRQALHAAGLRFRIHDKRLPGRPDIVLPSRRCVVEVRGCFWHRHPDPACPLNRTPKSRLEFWQGKFDENVARDHRNDAAIQEQGWTLIVVWECQILKVSDRAEVLTALVDQVKRLPTTKRQKITKKVPR